MKVTFTEKAINKIKTKLDANEGKSLKLKYDTDGCGCVVSGVSALWITAEHDEDDVALDTNLGPLLMEKSKLVFFDEDMTVDFVESANSFMLKCPSQILNPRMSLLVVEGGAK
ncbi:Iron-sulfur cluster insertion protein ErpA [Bacillus sp. THAF10]|uniref:iron-sulfur cluster biosynthesis family protein n=1 Tax=Bacillus sp. THAF10 TaxID=2587848 RepID=UPI00126831E9|nr:iron-sulfur cluster biosynthesis family protein [Bacillus sp. THAF10]QFT89571.1 Iron-sulfur cluster insertion protein ErpA [Bacillus sp. THAF10]